MKLRIDTEGIGFFCTKAPEQRTAHDTGAPRLDRETGLPLWQVQVMALDSTGGEVVAITVAGQPNVVVGSPVKVEGLTALPWSQEGRSGVAFRAESIRSAGDPVAGIIAPNRPASPSGGSSGPARSAA